ncbi:MAG: hypothetical protein K0R71_1061 [Bacillales bacterium]|nr:hypothetical protein [Bacillales bacterium]
MKVNELKNTAGGRFPEGSVLTVDFDIGGRRFVALNGGPLFKFTPAISFFVDCESVEEINLLWKNLSEGGVALMGLDAYPFSEKFGWVQDKYGVSWQLSLTRCKQHISPFLMFVGEQHGKAKEALDFYCKNFNNSSVEDIQLYGKDQSEPEGTVMIASFALNGQSFKAIDSAYPHGFSFTEAISFCVYCKTQEEIDFYWEELSHGGSKSECGWLKDQFGVSWQIIPEDFIQMITDENREKVDAVMDAVLKMKKPDIETLHNVYNQS